MTSKNWGVTFWYQSQVFEKKLWDYGECASLVDVV